jgi:hypothetical protein
MTDLTPPVNGQDIGLAARAGRVLLDRVLDAHQATFDEWVALRSLALGQDVTANFFGDQTTAEDTLADLAAQGFVTRDPEAALTADGVARYDALNADVLTISRRLSDGFAPEDLATTGRVLREVARRAMAS